MSGAATAAGHTSKPLPPLPALPVHAAKENVPEAAAAGMHVSVGWFVGLSILLTSVCIVEEKDAFMDSLKSEEFGTSQPPVAVWPCTVGF